MDTHFLLGTIGAMVCPN